MNNRREQLLIGSIVALVGAVATAILNLILSGKITSGFWWVWILGGFIGILLILLLYQMYTKKRLTYGCRIAIRTYDGNYVRVDLNQDKQLFGRATTINGEGIFEIVDEAMPFAQEPNRPVCYGHPIAFKALTNNRFVGADLRHDKQLTAWGTRLRSWETFTLCPTNNRSVLGDPVRYGNFFALKAHNEMYVECILKGDGRLLADVPQIEKGATFVFVNPAQHK